MSRYHHLLPIANKQASKITDAEVQVAVNALQADERVAAIVYAGRDSCGRPLLTVMTDEAETELPFGTFSIGRVIHALHETHSEQRARLADEYRQRHTVSEWEREKRAANQAKLVSAGYSLDDLNFAVYCMTSGRYVNPNSKAFRALEFFWEHIDPRSTPERPHSGYVDVWNFF